MSDSETVDDVPGTGEPLAPTTKERPGRIASLDGLRGVASLVVVIFHVVLNDPVVGARSYRADQLRGVGWLGAIMTFTPLHLLWAGEQAVAVFFVLSGFVLALPFARRPGGRRRGTWVRFYRSRAVRLYVPGIASLLLAYALATTFAYRGDEGMSPWVRSHGGAARLGDLLTGSTLLTYHQLNVSLWSLRWEVLFSLTLPLFLVVAAWRITSSWAKAIALFSALVFWSVVGGSPYFNSSTLLIFGFGVLMAFESDRLAELASHLTRRHWIGLMGLTALLLTLQWLVMPWGIEPGTRFDDLWMAYTSAGATLLVFIAAFYPRAQRLLERRPVQVLGLLSFSLYLVQEPITIRFAMATHSSVPLWLALPVEITLALLAAALFYRVVERPAHRLARRVGATPKAWLSESRVDPTGRLATGHIGTP
jgi:peptidoglycan/LPS O-acetylase OafA/YrhL